ncbi:hypothetical protein TNCV_3724431 [Trichonephila clavipes]|nr:hypothetical protein TNCV_3724431 [Trichonephila clavipes]
MTLPPKKNPCIMWFNEQVTQGGTNTFRKGTRRGGSAKATHLLPQVPRTDMCHYVHEGIEPSTPAELRSYIGASSGRLVPRLILHAKFHERDINAKRPAIGGHAFSVDTTACPLYK